MLHVVRWLSCDFPGCPATFEPIHYREAVARVRSTRSVHDAAATVGWTHTEQGDDLCKRHTDVHAGRPEQPQLFPVPDGDHAV